MEHFFPPTSSTDLRSDAHQSQIIGGNADEDHTQIAGGIQSNYWGDIPSGGFRGGCIPPTSLKVTILAEKSASISNNSAPVRDASPPHQPKPNEPGRKISLNFGEDLFFWRPPNFGRKKRLNFRFRPKNHSQFWWRPFFFFFFVFIWRPPNFGRKKRLNFGFRPKNQSQFRWRHPNFWGFVLKIPPTKIF